MESFLGSRSLGEESIQMWDLNKRLEAYLARVKHLEEENELLKAEIQNLKVGPVENSWRGKCEEQMAALRVKLDEAFKQKYTAELARDNLYEEVQQVKERCQKEQATREEAKKLLSISKKELEEEKRGHIWLRERATQLEKEIETLVEAHEEEKAGLDQEMVIFSRSLESFRATPLSFQPVEVEDYSKRLSKIWRGAVDTYKTEVSQLEATLSEAKENLWKATEDNRQNQLQLQQLEKELANVKLRKEMLEESFSQQWQHQQGEAEKFQLAIETLEEEKRSLRVQIAQILEDRQQLMHLKMSLSLEVATYRTLLEAESTRLQMPSTDYKLVNGLRDAKLEANGSKLQAAYLERGHGGPQNIMLSPIAFLKGDKKRQLPKNQNESFAVNLASVLPQDRRPVAREFRKANTALRSQPTKCVDTVLPQKDVLAFKLGSSQQNKTITATKMETVSQSFFHESPLLFNSNNSTVPDDLGDPSTSIEERHQKEEIEIARGETATQIEAEEIKKEELYEEEEEKEEEEEEKEPNEETPGMTVIQSVPYPTQLVSEALEIALKEVKGGEVRFDSGLPEATEIQNGISTNGFSSTEEENEPASSLSSRVLEEAEASMQKLDRGQREDCLSTNLPEDAASFEVSGEINGSQVASVEQGSEAGVWLTQNTELFSSHETQLPEEEGNLSIEQNQEVIDVPVTEEVENYKETRYLEQKNGYGVQPSILHSTVWSDGSEEVSECVESVSYLGTSAPAILEGVEESWESGTSQYDDHPAAEGEEPEETDGGVEDLEVVSTEALHLSEDEERRGLWSPLRENEEHSFQTETQESGLLQTEGIANDNLSSIIPSALSAGSHQEHLFLGVEEENLEEEVTLHQKTTFGLPEEEGEATVLDPEVLSAEKCILADEDSSRDEENIMAGEPTVMERADAQEECVGKPEEDILEPKDLHEEDSVVDNEEMKGNTVSSQEGGNEPDTAVQKDDLENVLRQETSQDGQVKETGEASPGQPSSEQKIDKEKIMTAFSETDGNLKAGNHLISGTEAVETEREKMGILEMEEIADLVSTHNLQNQENPSLCSEATQELGADEHQAEEQSQQTIHHGQSLVHGPSKALEVPPEGQSNDVTISSHETQLPEEEGNLSMEQNQEVIDVPVTEDKELSSSPQAIDTTSKSYHQVPDDYSGSENSLESLDTSPNASCETDGIETESDNSKQIMLEETLPDSTPLYMYDGQMSAAPTRECRPLSESEEDQDIEVPLLTKDNIVSVEDTQQVVEQEGTCNLQTKANDEEQVAEAAEVPCVTEEEKGCNMESASEQEAPPDSVKAQISEDAEESKNETTDLTGDKENQHTMEPEIPKAEEDFVTFAEVDEQEKIFKEGIAMGKEPEFREMVHEETGGTDFAWGPEKESVFQSDLLDSSNVEEGVHMDNDDPLEFSDLEAEGTHKVSPLTSVADLGEIVLEGAVSPGGQKNNVESETMENYKDESLAHIHQFQQVSDPEICEKEGLAQQKDLDEVSSDQKDFPGPSPEAAVSLSTDNMKDSDILEIVQQALEFNQELIKAAEQCAEAEQSTAGGDIHNSSEEQSRSASVDVDQSQVFQDTPETSSPTATDPKESNQLWVKNNANGLHQDAGLVEFTKEILNGIGDLHSGNVAYDTGTVGEELIEQVSVDQQFCREELDDTTALETLSQTPQIVSHKGAPRIEEVNSEVYEKVSLEHSNQETRDTDENLFSDIMQAACMKGKDVEVEKISIPPHFGDEVLCLESSQHLKFQPEDAKELWPSEDH